MVFVKPNNRGRTIMNKYKLSPNEKTMSAHSKEYFLCAIANELAEANRLKRSELELDEGDHYTDMKDGAVNEKPLLTEVAD